MGRDKFIDLMGQNGYHVKRKRRYRQTTDSSHSKVTYSNLIKDLHIHTADSVWVSDITYIETTEGFMYLSLVTDLYSRKILGYKLSDRLTTEFSIHALELALKESKSINKDIIHHSDRGIQYCSKEYTELLRSNGITSSMSNISSPQENAVAERLNGILKQEYGINDKYQSKSEAKILVKEAIQLYNLDRPHSSLSMKTPDEIYNQYYEKLSKNKLIY